MIKFTSGYINMEGPSLIIAVEQLKPFIGKKVLEVSGNTKIEKERIFKKQALDIFSWGKHLILQFDTFALKIHFLLFGSYEVVVKGKSLTGDYKRSSSPRLYMRYGNGEVKIFNSSVKFLETSHARSSYDFSVDVLSEEWNPKRALAKSLALPDSEIGDILLDQAIFSGVGNIIKNEILFLAKVNPKTKVKNITLPRLKRLIKLAKDFSWQFYEWKKIYMLKKHLLIYHKSLCPACGRKVIRGITGKRKRWSYYCPFHQPLEQSQA